MNRLGELESNSIFIIRQAFSGVKPLAMLWSLGKNSNVLLWLARKAFSDTCRSRSHCSTPATNLTRFMPSVTATLGAQLYQRPVPPVEETDPSLPPMSSAAARKTLGLKRLIEQRGLRGSARYPPRRAGRASQRTDFQPARRQRELRHQLRNFGTNSKPTFRMAPISASIRCWHGPNSISGAISSKKPYPSYRLILPKAANATARSVKKTSRFRSLRPRARSRKSSLNWNRRASRSAPAAAWSTNARMHSKLCVPPAICEPRTSSHGTVEPSCNAAQNRVCGSCRPWQVNADRLPRVRDRHSSLGPTWRQCRALDPKGLYRRARNGEITNFTGVSSPYEPPLAAELTIGDRQNGHRVLSR